MDKNLLKIMMRKSIKVCAESMIVFLIAYYIKMIFGGDKVNNNGMYNFGEGATFALCLVMIYMAYFMWSFMSCRQVVFQPFTNKTKAITAGVAYYISLSILYVGNLVISTLFCMFMKTADSDIVIVKLENILNPGYLIISFIMFLAIGTVFIGCLSILERIVMRTGKNIAILLLVAIVIMCFIASDESVAGVLVSFIFSYLVGECNSVFLYIIGSLLAGIVLYVISVKMSIDKPLYEIEKNEVSRRLAVICLLIYLVAGWLTNLNDQENNHDESNNVVFSEGLQDLIEKDKVIVSEKKINYIPDDFGNAPIAISDFHDNFSQIKYVSMSLSDAKKINHINEDVSLNSGEALMICVVNKDSNEHYNKVFSEIIENTEYDGDSYIEIRQKLMMCNYGLVPKSISKYSMKKPSGTRFLIVYSDEDVISNPSDEEVEE